MKSLSPDKLLGIAVIVVFAAVFLGVYVGLMNDKPDDIPFDIKLNYTPPND